MSWVVSVVNRQASSHCAPAGGGVFVEGPQEIVSSVALVAAVKAKEGTLYGRGLPRVTRRRLRIAET